MHCIAAKMIHHRELYGSLDEPTQCIIMRKEEPSSLQLMALNFVDKVCWIKTVWESAKKHVQGSGLERDGCVFGCMLTIS